MHLTQERKKAYLLPKPFILQDFAEARLDSSQRHKAVRKILELTRDPEICSIARKALEVAPAPENKHPDKISRKEWVLYLLGIPVAIYIFLVPRNPLAAIVGSCFVFAAALPAIFHLSSTLRAKIVWSIVLLIVDAAIGITVFHWLVEERDANVLEHLHPTSLVLNPNNLRSTVLGVINDNASEIVSDRIYCFINEAFNDIPARQIGMTTSQIISAPRTISPGGDVRLTQCLRDTVYDPLTCADVTVPMAYTIPQFPKSKGIVKFRFFLNKYNGQYHWTRVGVQTPVGLCGGARLPDEAFKLQ